MKTILIGWSYIILFLIFFVGAATLYAGETKRMIVIGRAIIVVSITAALWLTDSIL